MLVCFLTLLLAGASSTEYTSTCTEHMLTWFEVSTFYYLVCLFLAMAVYLIIRRHGFIRVTLNLGRWELLFLDYQGNWVYVLLVLMDLAHLGLAIWGSIEFFTDLRGLLDCFLQEPIFNNFVFMSIAVGYLYSIRLLITIVHFKYGIPILRWMRRRFSCFRRYDTELRQNFPVFMYS